MIGIDFFNVTDTFWNAIHYFQRGGLVMPALAATSIWLWTLIVMKLWELAGFNTSWKHSGLDGGGAGRLSVMTQRYRSLCSSDFARNESWLESLLIREKHFLDRHVTAIMLLSTIAPLIGLLGTVTGMIATFRVIEYYGAGNANGLAGGISEALITTQSGLVVAVPGLIMGNLIKRRVDRWKNRLDQYGLRLLEATVCRDMPSGESDRA
jgi:biopolymer transport protein ExbB